MTVEVHKKSRIFEHVVTTVFWLILFGAPLVFGDQENEITLEHLFERWRPLIPLFFAFVINRLLLLPKLFFPGKRGWYLLAVLGLVGALTYANQLTSPRAGHPPRMGIQPPPVGSDSEVRGLDPRPRLQKERNGRPPRPFSRSLVFSFLCLMVIGLDTGLKAGLKLTETEHEKAALQQQHTSTQLAFLRNQVSPHFFMNTLNNIHALIDLDSEEAKASIIKLSKLMRHLLYESDTDKIALKKEIDFIVSYVELMQLRYSTKVDVKMEIASDLPDRKIHPLLFTSILENAFKHGVSYGSPSFVHIFINWQHPYLNFLVRNSVHQSLAAQDSSGIGLTNTRQRLNLLYSDRHKLEIKESETEFAVNLSVPI